MGLRGRAAAVALAAVAVAVAAGCGGRNAATTTTAPKQTVPKQTAGPGSLFAYDASKPLAYRDAGRANSPYPIAVRNVSYAAPSGRVPAYLAVPAKGTKLPAVIYLHGSGEARERFLLPAVWVAGRGAVGMTLTLPSSSAGAAPSGLTPEQSLARDRRIFANDVIAVRRAVDLLQTMPRVDPRRIALVGWSLGARVGAVLAGVEPRLKAVVLMSGGAQPVSEYVKQAPAALKGAVRDSLTQIDPLRFIGRARPGSILIQDGRKDQVVPQSALLTLANAAPRGTVVRWYPAGHELNVQVYRDQLAFLSRKLPIRGPAVPGAETGP